MLGLITLASLLFAAFAVASAAADSVHSVECGPADTACVCDSSATVCKFQFYVELVPTFVKFNSSRPYTQGQGERVYISSTGDIVPYNSGGRTPGRGVCMQGNFVPYNGSYCLFNDSHIEMCISKNQLCTGPLTVDSRSDTMVFAINKQFPGPTIVVNEGQIVSVDVYNNLSSEAITVHWHGQHQVKTNFMDGVGLVTQCPIQPGSSFRYIFKASPSGTFWYHSHMGSQRANGLFGALIVKEKELNYSISFVDDPANYTLTLIDWFRDDFNVFFRHERFAIGLYPDLPPYTVPSDEHPAQPFRETASADFGIIGNLQFWSGLIQGKGRHSSVPYERSSLNIYEVQPGQTYRFRLIHTGTMYAFRFSIDSHKLKVMATDGYLVEPVEVDYVALHSGERYDVLVEANQPLGNFWIKAETFEIDADYSTSPPYNFLDHKAEAILHYNDADKPTPTDYANIPKPERDCEPDNLCKMLNCPFGEFHASYNIHCIPVHDLRLYRSTPDNEMPGKTPDITYFLNMGGFVSSEKPISSINDKLFHFPTYPPTVFNGKNDESVFCDAKSECNIEGGCPCTTVVNVGYNQTVRLVASAVGEERNSTHSIHIHGHSVHVLRVGYGWYSSENGSLLGSSRDLTCTKSGNDAEIMDHIRCPDARFRSPDETFPIDHFTVRKDTFIVPAGGYVVVQFRSDNPGYWFMHCHVNLHQREGMDLIVREATDRLPTPPDEMKTCASFQWDIDEFLKYYESSSHSAKWSAAGIILLSLIALLH